MARWVNGNGSATYPITAPIRKPSLGGSCLPPARPTGTWIVSQRHPVHQSFPRRRPPLIPLPRIRRGLSLGVSLLMRPSPRIRFFALVAASLARRSARVRTSRRRDQQAAAPGRRAEGVQRREPTVRRRSVPRVPAEVRREQGRECRPVRAGAAAPPRPAGPRTSRRPPARLAAGRRTSRRFPDLRVRPLLPQRREPPRAGSERDRRGRSRTRTRCRSGRRPRTAGSPRPRSTSPPAREAFEKHQPPEPEWSARSPCGRPGRDGTAARTRRRRRSRATSEPFAKDADAREVEVAAARLVPPRSLVLPAHRPEWAPAAARPARPVRPTVRPYARYLLGRVHAAARTRTPRRTPRSRRFSPTSRSRRRMSPTRSKTTGPLQEQPVARPPRRRWRRSRPPSTSRGRRFTRRACSTRAGGSGRRCRSSRRLATKEYAEVPARRDDAALRTGFCLVQTQVSLTRPGRCAEATRGHAAPGQRSAALLARARRRSGRRWQSIRTTRRPGSQAFAQAVNTLRSAKRNGPPNFPGKTRTPAARCGDILLELADALLTREAERARPCAYLRAPSGTRSCSPRTRPEEVLQRVVTALPPRRRHRPRPRAYRRSVPPAVPAERSHAARDVPQAPRTHTCKAQQAAKQANAAEREGRRSRTRARSTRKWSRSSPSSSKGKPRPLRARRCAACRGQEEWDKAAAVLEADRPAVRNATAIWGRFRSFSPIA